MPHPIACSTLQQWKEPSVRTPSKQAPPYSHSSLGSQFAYHPEFTNATMLVADPSHPSTAGLPPKWKIQDEIYNFNHDPRSLGAVVVLTADETSYTGTRPSTLS